MMECPWQVPSTWQWSVIGTLGNVVSGGTPSTEIPEYWGGSVIWFAPSDLTGYKQKFIARGAKTLTEKGLAKSSAKLIPAGSVMYSSRAPIGYVAINSEPSATNQGFKSVIPVSGVFNQYLYHYLKSIKHIAENRATGTTFKELSGSAFSALPVPIAPLNEQRRIVEEIDALFIEIDRGVESLQAAKKALTLYRHSLLKSAFQGRLTAEWRKQNADKLESPKALLTRIRAEREVRYKESVAAWQGALEQWRAGGGEGRRPAKPKQLDDIAPLRESELKRLPSIPEEWGFSRLGIYIEWIEAGKSFRCSETEPRADQVGVAKVSALTWGKYDESESKTCLDEVKMNESLFIQNGDFLLSRANTIDLVGAPVIAKKVTKRIMLSDKTLRIHFMPKDRRIFLQYLRSPFGRFEIEVRSTGNQGSMWNIGQDRIRNIIIPVFSEAEQAEIVQILDSRLDAAEKLNAELESALTRAEVLRQSILKKAFAGQLVSQDPDDEPASVLLARIRAERAEAPARRRAKRVASESAPVAVRTRM